MVATTPEYHLLGKRVAVGRLLLGTVIDSLQDLSRLNNGGEPIIEADRIDYFHDRNVQVSRDVALNGSAGVAAKALAMEGVGGEAGVKGERSSKDVYTIPDVYTWQFDAEKSDYMSILRSDSVQAYLAEVDFDPVFMITGLKISTKTSIDITKVRKLEGQLELGINAGTAVSIGPKIGSAHTVTMTQKGEELSARILAVRVRKLRYIKRGFMGLVGPRQLMDEPHPKGAELVGVGRSKVDPEALFDVAEESDMKGEMEGHKKVSEPGVTWIVPTSW